MLFFSPKFIVPLLVSSTPLFEPLKSRQHGKKQRASLFLAICVVYMVPLGYFASYRQLFKDCWLTTERKN